VGGGGGGGRAERRVVTRRELRRYLVDRVEKLYEAPRESGTPPRQASARKPAFDLARITEPRPGAKTARMRRRKRFDPTTAGRRCAGAGPANTLSE